MFVQNSPTWAKLALETLGPIWTLEPIWLFPFYSVVLIRTRFVNVIELNDKFLELYKCNSGTVTIRALAVCSISRSDKKADS